MQSESLCFLGIDGCRGGWIAALWRPVEGRLDFTLHPAWPAEAAAAATMTAVDMPLGLPERGNRRCDLDARATLPVKSRPRVFLGLRRPLLAAASYAEANALGRALDGKGLSKQAWFLLPKVRELDAGARERGQSRLCEVHPELVFHHLAGGAAVARKKTPEGLAQRLALLRAAGLGPTETWLERLPRRQAAADDLLDAAACALAARRIHEGRALRLPADEPPRDSCGLRMEIWF